MDNIWQPFYFTIHTKLLHQNTFLDGRFETTWTNTTLFRSLVTTRLIPFRHLR